MNPQQSEAGLKKKAQDYRQKVFESAAASAKSFFSADSPVSVLWSGEGVGEVGPMYRRSTCSCLAWCWYDRYTYAVFVELRTGRKRRFGI